MEKSGIEALDADGPGHVEQHTPGHISIMGLVDAVTLRAAAVHLARREAVVQLALVVHVGQSDPIGCSTAAA